ncbi:hypothetical protein quinque_003414 [Culex quinquefasciatus]
MKAQLAVLFGLVALLIDVSAFVARECYKRLVVNLSDIFEFFTGSCGSNEILASSPPSCESTCYQACASSPTGVNLLKEEPCQDCYRPCSVREVQVRKKICCEPTCFDDCTGDACTFTNNTVPNCVCLPGYVRHMGHCIRPKYCPQGCTTPEPPIPCILETTPCDIEEIPTEPPCEPVTTPAPCVTTPAPCPTTPPPCPTTPPPCPTTPPAMCSGPYETTLWMRSKDNGQAVSPELHLQLLHALL